MSLHPHHPIIYIRGFAATQGEIEDTVADPYMGFNLGSTKTRKIWNGELKRMYFESPLVRLQTDYGYQDVFEDGEDLIFSERRDLRIPYKSIIIFRYYDEASRAFSDGNTPPIEHFALQLAELVTRMRDRICATTPGIPASDFRVHLVAHSMGGLVARCFLQGPDLGQSTGQLPMVAGARAMVDKLFTYATPHNGIDLRIVRNVPAWASFGDVNNFNRERMAGYLGLRDEADPGRKDIDVADLGSFPAERVFNLVGTNPGDYAVMKGVSAWAAGDDSDGLVRMHNAVTHGRDSQGRPCQSPRAYVFRSHSGHYGIVNSEEGFQNLTRFLFGNFRMDGILDIDEITLPDEIQKKLGKLSPGERDSLKASYQFEVAVSLRNTVWQLHRRNVRENSAIFRTYEELFPRGEDGLRVPNRNASPHLFSTFLDQTKSVQTNRAIQKRSVSLAFDISAMVPEYTLGGISIFKRHYEGGTICRRRIIVEAEPDPSATGGWRINYGIQSETPNAAPHVARTDEIDGAIVFKIPFVNDSRPGIKASLRIVATPRQ